MAHEKLEELMFDTLLSDGSVEPKQTCCRKTKPQTSKVLPPDSDSGKQPASSFLRIFPRPVYNEFESLTTNSSEENQNAANELTALLEDVLFLIFKEKASASDATTAGINYAIEFTDPVNGVFPKAYNECRKELTPMSFLWDPILCDMYSKAIGQYLRVALSFNALFSCRPLPEVLPAQIPENVQEAAVSLVNLCIRHTRIVSGRDYF